MFCFLLTVTLGAGFITAVTYPALPVGGYLSLRFAKKGGTKGRCYRKRDRKHAKKGDRLQDQNGYQPHVQPDREAEVESTFGFIGITAVPYRRLP